MVEELSVNFGEDRGWGVGVGVAGIGLAEDRVWFGGGSGKSSTVDWCASAARLGYLQSGSPASCTSPK
jgi:hypothetical protein